MTSILFRSNPLFLRNGFECIGRWDIPLIKKQFIPKDNHIALSCSQIRNNEREDYKKCGVHFFVDDYRFYGVYNHPERSIEKLSQYAFLFTPDYSLYAEMPRWKQLENVAKNRWCGAYWQSWNRIVIPTVSWAGPTSYAFCFDGIELHGSVAVGMIGCKHSRLGFMRGYTEMLNRLEPERIYVIGKPFPEMEGNIFQIYYPRTRREVR